MCCRAVAVVVGCTYHVVDDRVQLRPNEIVLPFWKDDGTAVAADREGMKDVLNITCVPTVGVDSTPLVCRKALYLDGAVAVASVLSLCYDGCRKGADHDRQEGSRTHVCCRLEFANGSSTSQSK